MSLVLSSDVRDVELRRARARVWSRGSVTVKEMAFRVRARREGEGLVIGERRWGGMGRRRLGRRQWGLVRPSASEVCRATRRWPEIVGPWEQREGVAKWR